MNMVDKVAQAIHDDLRGVGDWSRFTDAQRDRFRFMARSAIRAMREPTPIMGAAANDAFPDAPREISCSELGCNIYRAMIDEALK